MPLLPRFRKLLQVFNKQKLEFESHNDVQVLRPVRKLIFPVGRMKATVRLLPKSYINPRFHQMIFFQKVPNNLLNYKLALCYIKISEPAEELENNDILTNSVAEKQKSIEGIKGSLRD